MTQENRPDQTGPILFLVLLVMVSLITVAWGVGRTDALDALAAGSDEPSNGALSSATSSPSVSSNPTEDPTEDPIDQPIDQPTEEPSAAGANLPHGGRKIFADHRFLVAYYGTAETGALGVLGETEPDEMERRVRRAAEPFRRPGRPVQIVYELIVTIADRTAGPDGDYSHDIARHDVRRYIRAAHRRHALLLLDLQPGRSDFLKVTQRWKWALEHPWVGIALDPEWRMGPHLAPAQEIGHVTAHEVNRTSRWLARLTRRNDLPEKLFVLHQFRTAMIENIERVKPRTGLAMVQHVDGFGTRAEKMATFNVVARPGQFRMGMKIFYDEDSRRMGPISVHHIRPRVRFVSYQ